MFPSNPDTRKRRALARVYALLLRAEENDTAHPEDFGENTGQAAEGLTPEGANHEGLYSKEG